MADTIIVLSVPPQGKSVDIEFAEKCNKGAKNRMNSHLSSIEKMQQKSELLLRREKENLKQELKGITKKNPPTKELQTPSFLKKEKSRIRQQAGFVRKSEVSENWSDDYISELSYDGSEDSSDADDETKLRRKNRMGTLEQRCRDKTMENLHRRYSAQVKSSSSIRV